MLFVVVVSSSVVISNVKEAVVRARSTKAITDDYFLNAKVEEKKLSRSIRVSLFEKKKRSYFFVRRKPTPKTRSSI